MQFATNSAGRQTESEKENEDETEATNVKSFGALLGHSIIRFNFNFWYK